MPISRHSQNIMRSPTRTASISVWSEPPAANRARVALMGNVTVFQELDSTPDRAAIQQCYLARHPDARRWLPGPEEPHIVSPGIVSLRAALTKPQAYWARFDPHVGRDPPFDSFETADGCFALAERVLCRRFWKFALYWLHSFRYVPDCYADRSMGRSRSGPSRTSVRVYKLYVTDGNCYLVLAVCQRIGCFYCIARHNGTGAGSVRKRCERVLGSDAARRHAGVAHRS